MSEVSWHKVMVNSVGHVDRGFVLQTLKSAIGFPFKFAAWTAISKTNVNFYVQSLRLASTIVNVPMAGMTLKLNTAQNPPAAPVTPFLRDQLMPELSSRLSPTGHLDLSNFAETNGLIWDFWLPLHKPTIRALINETIINLNFMDRLKSVDLSHNKLSHFEDLTFLHSGTIQVLIVNDNRIMDVKCFNPLRSNLLTELVVRNNSLLYPSDDGPPPSPEYIIKEILKMFPNLMTLDHEPINGLLKRSYPANEFDDQYLHPNKAIRLELQPGDATINLMRSNDRLERLSEPETYINYRHGFKTDTRSQGDGDDLTRLVTVLEKRLSDTTTQMDKLTKLYHELSERQLKTEKNLMNVEEENLKLRIEVRYLQDKHKRNSVPEQPALFRLAQCSQDDFSDVPHDYDRPQRIRRS